MAEFRLFFFNFVAVETYKQKRERKKKRHKSVIYVLEQKFSPGYVSYLILKVKKHGA